MIDEIKLYRWKCDIKSKCEVERCGFNDFELKYMCKMYLCMKLSYIFIVIIFISRFIYWVFRFWF